MNRKPNILLILTDQQSAEMMSCAGNPYLNTPAMDLLANSGVRFEKTYCTNPVCVPSRFSLMTGRMPSEIALRSNDDSHIQCVPEDIKKKGMGWLVKEAGYDVAYGGKVHLPKMSAEDIGFNYITSDERQELAQVCADFIKEEREKPFFLVASFINPHDICYMAIRDENPNAEFFKYVVKETETLDEALKLPEDISEEEFFKKYCPPLPDNFEPQEDEPEAVDYLLNQRTFKKKAREEYSEKRWRLHRWAYCRLTEMVDRQIGQVLDAVKERGKDEETVIIFTSDHGDMDSAHRLEHKTVFYEEACRVPLIIKDSCNKISSDNAKNRVDSKHLISNGLDILPTICDYAGIDWPPGLKGESIRPLVGGNTSLDEDAPSSWRDYVPVESEVGKMIVTSRYKYALYDEGSNREQLYDLLDKPMEMKNHAKDSQYLQILNKLRSICTIANRR